jgi:hypothetical protein
VDAGIAGAVRSRPNAADGRVVAAAVDLPVVAAADRVDAVPLPRPLAVAVVVAAPEARLVPTVFRAALAAVVGAARLAADRLVANASAMVFLLRGT